MADTLGIIAGSRALPFVIAKAARREGLRLVAAGFENETDPGLVNEVDELVWLRVGQLTKLIETFAGRAVRRCVMAGQIAPKNLFDLRPDLKAMMLLVKLKEKNAHTIFGAIAAELAKAGVELIPATPWLKEVMPGSNFHLGARLSRAQRDDVEFGYGIAKEVSRLEIGQTVVVKNGTVLAVEGFEGTDRCLARGGELAGSSGGALAVKVARHNHDMRFDIPCVGAQTIRTCAQARIAVLAIESEKTILLERAEVEALLKKEKIALVSAPL